MNGLKITTGTNYIARKSPHPSFLPQVKTILMQNILIGSGKMRILSKCKNRLHNLNGQASKSFFKDTITMKLLPKHRKRKAQFHRSFNNNQRQQRRPTKLVLHPISYLNRSLHQAIQTMPIKEDVFLLLALLQATNLTNSYLIPAPLLYLILLVQPPKLSVYRSTKFLRTLLYCKSLIQARVIPHTSIVRIICSLQIKTRALSLCPWPTTTQPL